MNGFSITPFRGPHLLLLLLTAAAVLLACVPLGIASDAASFPDFQTAAFSSPPSISACSSSRVFSLGFVIVGRSFLIIGKRKEQPFSCVKIAALNRWFTILECQYLNLHGLIAYQKIITKQRADVSKSLINFFTRKIMHC